MQQKLLNDKIVQVKKNLKMKGFKQKQFANEINNF